METSLSNESNPFVPTSAKHVPGEIWPWPCKFTGLQGTAPTVDGRSGRNGKKTAETCPNMTVSADMRNSDAKGEL
jgi:hypothetical protein